ncbi:hypothetical protein AGABI2DRAFT_212754 [Agaricus bisporus var. bisporus H97]|uniref:hypothetical protein n=1 Tax=Agaricus bisporus var. bisporus (strain H97 / ATCC MYA-4626 / FGSC 10389) TaxID=936046 RepID=UPI00029F7A89|nr:hypothetical protein AGABI2DRAFT_212754 [Agaricus bisporus var. bisporus H97]EKV41774.1 hypothetical protein AGABI2DRAFT_212754 [Agaricus bisporus var. bisporus H97]
MPLFKSKSPAAPGARISEKNRQQTVDGQDQFSTDTTSSSRSSHSSSAGAKRSKSHLPQNLQWIPKAWTWSNIKVVIRCAVVAWVSSLFLIVPRLELVLGQASFVVLIAAFLSPPNDPFTAVLERELLILLFVTLAWAWSCLALFLANLARTNTDYSATVFQAATGQYIQAGPTVIIAVFLFFGSAFFLYIKARLGPGPYFFACIFACISIDTSLTFGVLYPFPFYRIGQTIAIPLAFHSAISLLGSIFIFPSTISAQFTSLLQAFLTPLISSLEQHRQLLGSSVASEEFSALASSIKSSNNAAEGSLLGLAAAYRLLRIDIIWARFAPTDFCVLHSLGRKLSTRADGMTRYFVFANPHIDKFPATPMPSGYNTPAPTTPQLSRAPSIEHPEGRPTLHHSDHHHHHRHRTHSHTHQHGPHLHSALLHLSLGRKREEGIVGMFESQRYMNLEAKMHDPCAEHYTQLLTELLRECCDDLLVAAGEGLAGIRDWLGTVRKDRFKLWRNTADEEAERQNKIDAIQALRHRVAAALEEFRSDKRLKVLEPYKAVFENRQDHSDQVMPNHQYLFHCYVYQFHLMQFSDVVVNMLNEVVRLEVDRERLRLWTPIGRFLKNLKWSKYDVSGVHDDDDDDPDVIQGVQPAMEEDLGLPRQRDPDALPPRNVFEWAMSVLYYGAVGLMHGNVLFAIKAGLFTIALSLPFFFKGSASFAYQNRFVWGLVMGQLTIARFRGDTIFGLVARIMSTFLGSVVGMANLYISRGNAVASPYGLAAVFGVCFPFFYYGRLYWPGPPMTNAIFFVTIVLVVGYSYQDVYIVRPGSPGSGFETAWRRFVLVTAGVFASFIVSFLPPATTIRRYQRRLLSTTSAELGSIYCSIVSFANAPQEIEAQEIITCLIAIRSKLKRSAVLRQNVIYEFSLRGRWPASRYQKIMELQLQVASSLAHLLAVIDRLEPAWTKALLKRTRLTDPNFQGDVLAVISMITSSLRTGSPLPQITPAPLVDRFALRYHGLNVIHQQSEVDFGLPRSLTMETLQNEQYLMFCVGVATTFNIMKRLDRLMVATKDIVGEQYHIYGVGAMSSPILDHLELGHKTAVHFRPPKDA